MPIAINLCNFWAAAVIAAFFSYFVVSTDYGTTINDFPHIRDRAVDIASVNQQTAVFGDKPVLASDLTSESLDKQYTRFKLYSVESDEVLMIMGLARVKPGQFQFDPGIYLYGGAFLYPLGGMFFFADKLGLLEIGPLAEMLQNPDRMDRVYQLGRMLAATTFLLSGWLLFRALLRVTDPVTAVWGLLIYLAVPVSIMFAQVMKPHWYSLVFTNLALLAAVRLWKDDYPRQTLNAVLIAAGLGLAVGCNSANGLFAVLIWCAMVALWRGKRLSIAPLLWVPPLSLVFFFLTNPYVILNFEGYRRETDFIGAWYNQLPGLIDFWEFWRNSLLIGWGVAFTLLFMAVVVWQIRRPSFAAGRAYAIALVMGLLVVAVVTSAISTWHINARFAGGMLGLAVLLVTITPLPRRPVIVGLVAMLTIAQAFPLMLAYIDEDDPAHSTRLQSAAWITENVPEGARLCMPSITLTPYETPPIILENYNLVNANCEWRVAFERQAGQAGTSMPGLPHLAARFQSRLLMPWAPLVFSHINPQVSIYKAEAP